MLDQSVSLPRWYQWYDGWRKGSWYYLHHSKAFDTHSCNILIDKLMNFFPWINGSFQSKWKTTLDKKTCWKTSWMWAGNSPLWQQKPAACQEKHCQQVEEVFLPSAQHWWDSNGVRVQLWVFQDKRGRDKLELVHQRDTKMIKGLEFLSFERLRGWDCSFWRRWDSISVYKYPKNKYENK